MDPMAANTSVQLATIAEVILRITLPFCTRYHAEATARLETLCEDVLVAYMPGS